MTRLTAEEMKGFINALMQDARTRNRVAPKHSEEEAAAQFLADVCEDLLDRLIARDMVIAATEHNPVDASSLPPADRDAEIDSIAEKISTLHWAFDRGDSRQESVRALAERVRNLKLTPTRRTPEEAETEDATGTHMDEPSSRPAEQGRTNAAGHGAPFTGPSFAPPAPASAVMADVARKQEAHEAKMAKEYPGWTRNAETAPDAGAGEELSRVLDTAPPFVPTHATGTTSPTPADRDAELERLLSELEQACYRYSDMVSMDNAYAVKSAEIALYSHVRRLVEEARGETVGYAVVRKSQWGDMGFQPIALLRHTIVRGEAIRVRLVRAPEEAEHG